MKRKNSEMSTNELENGCGGPLLALLAEVASQTLHLEERERGQNVAMSGNRLVRHYAVLDGDEMRRRFRYTCAFDKGRCATEFSSFGSEWKARQLMKTHLLAHVSDAGRAPAKQKAKPLAFHNDNNSCVAPVQHEERPSILELYLRAEKVAGGKVAGGSGVASEHSYSCVGRNIPRPATPWPERRGTRDCPRVAGDEGTTRPATSQLASFMIGEIHNDTALVAYVESEQVRLMQLPHVGQEVSVYTSLRHPIPALPGVKSASDTPAARKHKSRLITQTKADKDKALELIEASKLKGQSPERLECDICDPPRQFTALTTLVSHYRSHAGIKLYACSICEQEFTRQHSLNYHLLIHGNLSRFTCADCGRKFRHPSHFREHMRRHTGEAPYECAICVLRFKTRNTFKRHLKTRHGVPTSKENALGTPPGESSVPAGMS